MKAEDMTHTEVIVHNGNSFNDGIYMFVESNGTIRFRVYSATSGQTWRTFRSASGVIQKNQWHHVAATLDGNQILTLYIDGAVPNVVSDSLSTSNVLTTEDKGELIFGGGGSNF